MTQKLLTLHKTGHRQVKCTQISPHFFPGQGQFHHIPHVHFCGYLNTVELSKLSGRSAERAHSITRSGDWFLGPRQVPKVLCYDSSGFPVNSRENPFLPDNISQSGLPTMAPAVSIRFLEDPRRRLPHVQKLILPPHHHASRYREQYLRGLVGLRNGECRLPKS
jgi:hypothetical protein